VPVWQIASAPLVPTSDGRGTFSISATNPPQTFYRLKIQTSTNGSFAISSALPAMQSYSPFATEAICGPNRAYIRKR